MSEGLLPGGMLRPGLNTDQHLTYDTRRVREEALRRTVAWKRANPPEGVDRERFDYAALERVW